MPSALWNNREKEKVRWKSEHFKKRQCPVPVNPCSRPPPWDVEKSGQLCGAASPEAHAQHNIVPKGMLSLARQEFLVAIGKVSRTARLLKHGTAVGIGLNVTATALEIKEACSTGREDVCERAKYVESGKLVLGVGIGIEGGAMGASGGIAVCAAIFTLPTAGWGGLACGIIGGVAGGYLGGMFGEKIGEYAGEILYEWSPGQ